MANKTKRIFKRILQYTVIIAITFLIVSAGATKVIYDFCFPRYESPETVLNEELVKLNEERAQASFYSGENLLAGYLYSPADGTKDNLVVFVLGMNAAVNDYLWQIKSFTDNGYGVFIKEWSSDGSYHIKEDPYMIWVQLLRDYARKKENGTWKNPSVMPKLGFEIN